VAVVIAEDVAPGEGVRSEGIAVAEVEAADQPLALFLKSAVAVA
jgi:hypothetical protein